MGLTVDALEGICGHHMQIMELQEKTEETSKSKGFNHNNTVLYLPRSFQHPLKPWPLASHLPAPFRRAGSIILPGRE